MVMSQRVVYEPTRCSAFVSNLLTDFTSSSRWAASGVGGCARRAPAPMADRGSDAADSSFRAISNDSMLTWRRSPSSLRPWWPRLATPPEKLGRTPPEFFCPNNFTYVLVDARSRRHFVPPTRRREPVPTSRSHRQRNHTVSLDRSAGSLTSSGECMRYRRRRAVAHPSGHHECRRRHRHGWPAVFFHRDHHRHPDTEDLREDEAV